MNATKQSAKSAPSPDDSPETRPDPKPATRRRRGKIARLPLKLRELINLMLRDGVPYAKISHKLAEHGHTLDKDNLSRWHTGGYQDWVQEQAWLDEMRARLEFATEVVNQPNANRLDTASLRIAVTRMYGLLLSFDPATLTSQLASQPTAYSRILSSLCKLNDSIIRSERHRFNSTPLFGDSPLFTKPETTA